ncbi:dihydroxyacetone kinase [Acinetobacter calcoaceticus]|uniref:Dihydroxyacetone kinase n=1 Tax=Acinetobacter calcoaceticus TaxID=471 RepID=A0A4R1XQA9_ACICA|nr:dihydroxyacetone kinase [Acinetobacter calcoaceticus]
MKYFKNRQEDIVKESILGTVKSNPQLGLLHSFPQIKVVLRKDWDKSKVALISGGGSGHEPAHAGFVGQGMLTAAVCGEVFASPSVDAVLSAIIATTGAAGCLLIVKNYTGDRLNFGLAAEQAKAMGYKVAMIIVNDDVALGVQPNSRGIAGTVLLHKVLGALAEQNTDLEQLLAIATQCNDNIYSLSLALTECHRFNQPEEARIAADQVELGLGIHGEPGAAIIDYASATELVTQLLSTLASAIPVSKSNTEYALMINNLGNATPIEMYIVTEVIAQTTFGQRAKYLIGPAALMTALNMNGISISVLLLDPSTEAALIAETTVKQWPGVHPWNNDHLIAYPQLPETLQFPASTDAALQQLVEQLAQHFIHLEDQINLLDAQVGDGDAGSTFATSGRNILKYREALPFAQPAEFLATLGRILARESGGSSGVLLSIMFTAASEAYRQQPHWGRALLAGLRQMQSYSGAKLGNRTMIDVLEPVFVALAADADLSEIVVLARQGAEATKQMNTDVMGRSAYVPEAILKDIPDPGAAAIARAIEMLLEK